MSYDGPLTDNELRSLGSLPDTREVADTVPGSVNFGPLVEGGAFIGAEAYSALKGVFYKLIEMVDGVPGFSLTPTVNVESSDWNSHAWGPHKGEMLHSDWFREKKYVGRELVWVDPIPPSWWDEKEWPNDSYEEVGYESDGTPIVRFYKWGYVAQSELSQIPVPHYEDPEFVPGRWEVLSEGVKVPIIPGNQTAYEGLAALATTALLGFAGKATGTAVAGFYAKSRVSAYRGEVLERLQHLMMNNAVGRQNSVSRIKRIGVTKPDNRELERGIASALASNDKRPANAAVGKYLPRGFKIPTIPVEDQD
jgi:hypothetical protein